MILENWGNSIFLVALGILWLLFASVQDLRKREIENWIAFSLVTFALAYRAFLSVFEWNVWYFVYGLAGLLVFVVLGYGLYYSRLFAAGDTKLFMALGSVLFLSLNLMENLFLALGFVLLMIFVGGIYGVLYSIGVAILNRKAFTKVFYAKFKENIKMFYVSAIFVVLSLVFSAYSGGGVLYFFSLLFLILPFLLVYSKAIEECFVVSVPVEKLTIGDWLYADVVVHGKKIKKNWEGLSEEDLKFLKKYARGKNSKIRVRYGVPFVPAFLFAFVLLILAYFGIFNFLA